MINYTEFKTRFLTLNEGGNAIKGVTRINQENATATYKKVLSEILPKLKLKEKDVASLGSTGKKAPGQSSGDIDIAISAPAILKSNKINTFEDIMDMLARVAKSLGHEYKDMRGIGIISIAFPIENIDGKQPNDKVQVDLMVVESVKYATWAYYSPTYIDSEFKGVYRNYLIIATTKFAGFKVTEKDKETKEPISWSRFYWNLSKGLQKGSQTRRSPKTGKIVKSTVSSPKEFITDNPDEMVSFLFGDKYKANDILTFEDTLRAILSNDFPYKKDRKKILKMATNDLQSHGYPIPKILAKHV